MPSGAGVVGGPAAPPPRNRRRSRTAAVVAAVAALALVVGAAAFVGIDRSGSGSGAGSASGITGLPVATQVPPLSGDETEPVAAVAEVLSPAVVQIQTDQGLGSGFVYDRSGLIMTAGHVTAGSSEVEVRLADGQRLTGKVLGEDDATDVAVVKIDPPDGLAVATLATGVPVQVGQTAVAIGSPFGLDQTVTAGIVSAVGRSVETPGGVIPAVQTDAPINSGNSGGALADRRGRIIGINDSIVTGNSGSTGNVGVGFAIPIDIAKGVADDLVAGRSTAGGFLGVEGADATGSHTGAAITAVQDGSPADEAGLTDADVVTAIDGHPVSSMIDLGARIRTAKPGEEVDLTVVRDGHEREVSVTLATAPSN